MGEIEPPEGKGASIHKFISQLLFVNIWKCYVSNFIKNVQWMKNVTFLTREGPPGGKGALIHKFVSQLLFVNIWKGCVSNLIKIARWRKNLTAWGIKDPRGGQEDPISKIRKILIQNGGPNPNWKFQHYSSIIKCLEIGGNYSTFGGLRPLIWGRSTSFQKFVNTTYRTVVRTHTENFSSIALLGCIKTGLYIKCTREVTLLVYIIDIVRRPSVYK